MDVRLATIIAGVAGDSCTFLGSCLLAWDALAPEKAFEDDQRVIAIVKNPALAKLPIEMDGRKLETEEDVKVVLMHRRAKKAKVGFVLLAFGFAALLAVRILELAN